MPCSTNFSMTLQAEILLTEILNFLKQVIILKLVFNLCYISRLDSACMLCAVLPFMHFKLTQKDNRHET